MSDAVNVNFKRSEDNARLSLQGAPTMNELFHTITFFWISQWDICGTLNVNPDLNHDI